MVSEVPSKPTEPTPNPEINDLLQALLTEVQALLGEGLVGLYVHGSLASGDFAPLRSDVDFVAATREALPASLLPQLAAMHARLRGSNLKWAAKLEGSYIPLAALRRYDPANCRHPALRIDGSFDVDEHGSDWVIQQHILREHGIALMGSPPAHTLIDPIEPAALRQAAWGILDTWWRAKLDDPALLRSSEYQAYAVLTMCRALYTLQYGRVASKKAAAGWAQERLESRWSALIERALAWATGEPWDCLDETLAFIAYTLQAGSQSIRSQDSAVK